MHELLIRRVEIGREVAKAKAGAGAGGPNLRPGREAQIMRRLADRNRDPLSVASVARIWREILSANLNQQISINAAVFAPEIAIRDLALEYCGTASSISPVDSAEAAVAAVTEGSAQIAILPGIVGGTAWRWWPLILDDAPGKPRVLARLPFFTTADHAGDALIIGPQEPEPSGDDVTLFAIAGESDASDGRLIDEWNDGGRHWRLVEIDGFADHHGKDDGRYRLGAYATQSAL